MTCVCLSILFICCNATKVQWLPSGFCKIVWRGTFLLCLTAAFPGSFLLPWNIQSANNKFYFVEFVIEQVFPILALERFQFTATQPRFSVCHQSFCKIVLRGAFLLYSTAGNEQLVFRGDNASFAFLPGNLFLRFHFLNSQHLHEMIGSKKLLAIKFLSQTKVFWQRLSSALCGLLERLVFGRELCRFIAIALSQFFSTCFQAANNRFYFLWLVFARLFFYLQQRNNGSVITIQAFARLFWEALSCFT